MATQHGLPWQLLTRHTLDSIGIGSENDIDVNIQKTAFEKLKDDFHRESIAKINSDQSKLRTYAKLKTVIGFEEYLKSIKNIMDRTAITKIRLSNHDLLIEKGRHQGLGINERLSVL